MIAIIFIIIFGIIVGFIVLRYSFLVVTIEGSSMEPYLLSSEKVLVFRYFPKTWLKKGNIVVFERKEQFGHSSDHIINSIYIKRITGLPHEVHTSQITDLAPQFRDNAIVEYDEHGQKHWSIPPHHIFVQSDNITSAGFDSLTWGPIPRSSVIGIVISKLEAGNHLPKS